MEEFVPALGIEHGVPAAERSDTSSAGVIMPAGVRPPRCTLIRHSNGTVHERWL